MTSPTLITTQTFADADAALAHAATIYQSGIQYLRQTLQDFVTGHTPQQSRSITVRYGGRAVLIDTGMLPYYKGRASALEILGNKLTAFYEDGKVTLQ